MERLQFNVKGMLIVAGVIGAFIAVSAVIETGERIKRRHEFITSCDETRLHHECVLEWERKEQ